MKNTIEYKGYIGSVEFSETDKVFFGKVMGIRTLISYEGTTAQELLEDFMVLLMIIWSYARQRELNQKKHTRAASMCVFQQKCISRLLYMLWSMESL